MSTSVPNSKKRRRIIGLILRHRRKMVPSRKVEIVADEVGIDPLHLIRIEQGRWQTSDQLLEKVARAAGIKPQELKDKAEELSQWSLEDIAQRVRQM